MLCLTFFNLLPFQVSHLLLKNNNIKIHNSEVATASFFIGRFSSVLSNSSYFSSLCIIDFLVETSLLRNFESYLYSSLSKLKFLKLVLLSNFWKDFFSKQDLIIFKHLTQFSASSLVFASNSKLRPTYIKLNYFLPAETISRTWSISISPFGLVSVYLSQYTIEMF